MGLLRVLEALLCVAGVALSAYALHVELKGEAARELGEEYEAACDIDSTTSTGAFAKFVSSLIGDFSISCSSVFSSEYGKGFGLIQKVVGDDSVLVQPNSIYGLMFYPAVLIASSVGARSLVLAMAVASCLGSCYLGYILYFVLHDVCIVCFSTYVVNIGLLLCAFAGRGAGSAKASGSKKMQ